MRRFRAKLAALLDETRFAAQQNIPSENLRNPITNRQLAPISFDFDALFTGQLGLNHGGTGSDLSGGGPGILFQASMGADLVIGDVPFSFIDFSGNLTGTGATIVYDNTGAGSAAFGQLPLGNSNAVSGTLGEARGGTGVSNAGKITNANNTTITGGGTLALGGFTLTAPATGTAALLGTAQTFSETNAFDKLLRAHTTSGTTGYGIRFSDGSNDFGSFQCLDGSGQTSLFFTANRQYDGSAWQQLNSRVGGTWIVNPSGCLYQSFPVSSSTPTTRFTLAAAGYVEMSEITAPAAGAANTGRMYFEDNGAGKTRMMVIFATGAAQQIAIQP